MKRVTVLLLGDLRNVARDSFLLMMLAIPLLLTLLVRFAVPFAAEQLKDLFDLREHYRFIAGLLLFFPGMLFGAVLGFLLLDERDEGILRYMATTPLTTRGYLRFRLLLPTLSTALYSAILLPLGSPVPLPFPAVIPAIICSALTAPLLALFLGAFASNKVEGMALYKLSGLLLAGPALAWFTDSAWSYAAGILPGWWMMHLFLEAYNPGTLYFAALPAAVLTSAGWTLFFYRLFLRKQR